METDKQKVLLIDGNSIVNRAFYAMPPLTNSSGLHTNAVFGFTTMLLKVIEEEKPTHLLVAFDAGKITFRHEGYAEYKGGRQKTPPELSEQFPLLKELIGAFSIRQFELPGYEADDIIGTLARLAEEQGQTATIVSGDKDMLQLASDGVTVLLTRKGVSEVERFTPDEIARQYDGLTPNQIIDLKGLMGDTSDNIPGIPGIGPKTALKLLADYGTVENVLEHADEIKGKVGDNVRSHADSARMSKKLATIFREVPMDWTWEQLAWSGYEADKLAAGLRKLEFKSLIERLDLYAAGTGAAGGSGAEAEPAELLVYQAVENEAAWAKLNGDLQAADLVIVESHGDNPHQSEGIALAVATPERSYIVSYEQLTGPEAAKLREWLADEGAAKTGYDLHRAELVLARSGIVLRGQQFDVQLAAYLLDPTEADPSLAGLLQRHGLRTIPPDEAVYGKGAKFRLPGPDALRAHLAAKAGAVRRLAKPLAEELDESGMRTLYYELEQPLAVILAGMEKLGITTKAEALEELGKEFQVGIESMMASVHRHAGMEFNIGSTKQLGEVLFDKLGLPSGRKTKTGYSTDAEVLERLAPYHEIVQLILNYRTLTKLQSTYIEGLLKEIRPEDGKIHTFFRQTIAATGRLSSQFPNLQNIPIRLEEGRQIRKAFVPSEAGWLILAADYSQIELRVLAHISGDEGLKEAFRNEMDIHTKTAMDVFGVTPEQVDSNMRRQAKAVNFGIVYGISDYGLSQNLNITRKEAGDFIEQYLSAFPGVRRYMDDIKEQARRDGYVTTLLGRRRYLPDIKASNFNLRSFAERTAMNTPIQGTAADIIKFAMVRMDEALKSRKLRSRMLLQVHDELVFEVPPEELETMKAIVPAIMAEAFPLDVPLKADVNVGTNWYEAK
ncbi:DNA polymerase I [Cohnella fermenti]|uniref:DNA polymerase I n=1 Tax=Cohnella fermenti TaxID=2565925 RepID=A0A4S4BMI4_9BACL|nr:DNA polymerase I [Cohnella fermenti]THF75475.1 DNA polymerase I [Cohnella fermenti]